MKLTCLVFLLAKERYAHPVDSLKEIMCYSTPTPVPGAPEEVLGILNVRGEIVTVISGRAMFDLESASAKNEGRIIIIDSADGLLGLVVDGVEEIVTFQEENKTVFHDLPDATLISETIQHKGRLHILIDLTGYSEKHAVKG